MQVLYGIHSKQFTLIVFERIQRRVQDGLHQITVDLAVYLTYRAGISEMANTGTPL